MQDRLFTVRASTAGSPSPRYEHLSGGYEWRNVPGWTGGNIPEVREPDGKRSGPPPSSSKSPESRAARMAVFAAAWDRGRGMSVAAAGRAAGVTETTAKSYRRELEQRGEGRAAGTRPGTRPAAEEPHPSKIVAALHEEIAAMDPERAALVADFEALQKADGS